MLTIADWQMLYVRIGRLLETAPVITLETLPSSDVRQWIARGHAAIGKADEMWTYAEYSEACRHLDSMAWESAVQRIFVLLHQVHARAELECPASVAGSFIPVGDRFSAFAAVARIVGLATHDVFVVDPYLDHTFLLEFALSVPETVRLRMLAGTKEQSAALRPAANRWVEQHKSSRPLQVRFTAQKNLHDRAIFLDGSATYLVTQSFRDLAARSPAEIVRTDETAKLKICAYEAIWESAAESDSM